MNIKIIKKRMDVQYVKEGRFGIQDSDKLSKTHVIFIPTVL
jgi:hypothetical protein